MLVWNHVWKHCHCYILHKKKASAIWYDQDAAIVSCCNDFEIGFGLEEHTSIMCKLYPTLKIMYINQRYVSKFPHKFHNCV